MISRLSLILKYFLAAVVQLHEIGIMHTNLSEANMMALQTNNSQGILVGFEFAIFQERSSPNKRVCPDRNRPSQDGGTDTESFSETNPSAALEQVTGDTTTHHVATLPLDRCTDQPPVHRFQHELESFIWSVLFIQTAFRSGRRIINSDVEKWYLGDWKLVIDGKGRFLKKAADDAMSAGQFAESLGVDPQPLKTCASALAVMLIDLRQLDAERIFAVLQEALDAYTANELITVSGTALERS